MAEKTVEQKAAAALFGEIAAIADELQKELRNSPFPHDDPDAAYQTELRVQSAIKQIGMIADMGSARNGGPVVMSNPADWILSPLAAEALRAADGKGCAQ